MIAVRVNLAVEGNVLVVADAIDVSTAHAEQQLIRDDGPTQTALGLHLVAVAASRRDVPLVFIRRGFSGNEDGTPRGITPIERALGPAKHLNLLNVDEFLRELSGINDLHTIYDHGYRRLTVADLTDATNSHE